MISNVIYPAMLIIIAEFSNWYQKQFLAISQGRNSYY